MTRGKKGLEKCTIQGCERKYYGKGFCELHYQRIVQPNNPLKCSIESCELPSRSRGYCKKHYTRLWRYGDPLHIEPKKPRKINKANNFLYDLSEKQEDTPVEFNKIFRDNFMDLLA